MTKNNYNITFKTTIELLPHLPGMHYIFIPTTVVKSLGGGFNHRLICTVNNALGFQCGLVALGTGNAYISITKTRLAKLGLTVGNMVEIKLKKDVSQFGMQMPVELNTLLNQDDEGNRRFFKLTPGKQRYIIQYVGAVKNPDKRIERAILLIQNLKNIVPGKENFREILGLPREREE